jgi:hypothetical protein
VVEHFAGDLECVLAREVGVDPAVREFAQVEVVDHLLHEVAHVLDQRDVTVDVAGRAQPVEDLEAEAMGGLDRGSVEVRDGLGQAVAPSALLVVIHFRQQSDDLVVLGWFLMVQNRVQPVVRAHQPLTYPLPELAGGHARERDDEEPVDRLLRFGYVTGREGRDGERLAGAGAGLQQRHAARQRPGDLEGLGRNGGPRELEDRHSLRTVSCASSPAQSSRA